jgi:adhesin/invasin
VNVTRDPAPASIAVTAPTSSIVSGGTLQLATVVKNARGQVITPSSITYTSSAPNVAAVSGSGLVTSLGPVGAANITAAIGTSVTSTPVSVTVSPGAIAHLTKQADLPASATVASSSAISAKATDSFGNPVPGATVTFAATGGGAVTPASVTTDANGVAGASFKFSNTAGTNTVVATVTGFSGSPATFTADGTAGPASSNVVVVGTDGQTAKVGTTVPNPPAVRILDAFGNPIVGLQVTFSTASGGQGQAAFVPTNANGVAAYDRWVLTTVGTNNLYVNVGSFPQTVFTATGTN